MLCIGVSLNGVPQIVAGAPSAESIEASVGLYPGFQEAFLRITGTILPNDQPPADADWLSSSLKIGDVVEVRLIDSPDPTAPRLGRADTTVNARQLRNLAILGAGPYARVRGPPGPNILPHQRR